MRTDLNADGGAERPRDGDLGQRLRALPDRVEPPFDFVELRRRARTAGRMGGVRRDGSRRAAPRQPALWLMAATVTAVAVGLGLRYPSPSGEAHVVAAPRVPTHAVATGSAVHADAQLIVAHAAPFMETQPRRALVRVDSQLPVMVLEDRIATVDDQLNAARVDGALAPQVMALQRDRAQLVESLAQVRYARDLVEMQ